MDKSARSLDLLVYGSSGHAKAVLDAALRSGRFRVIGLLDDDPARHGMTVLGLRVLGAEAGLQPGDHAGSQLVLAVGSNRDRQKLWQRLQSLGRTFACVVHPSASVGQEVLLGAGTVVLAGAVINPGTVFGEQGIVNTGGTVDHDCQIGAFVHVSPGAHLAGNVRVGALAHVGIGACVIPGITIGEGATVGAGAAVVKDVGPGEVVGGVPARAIRHREGK